jgi:hypothetical protein
VSILLGSAFADAYFYVLFVGGFHALLVGAAVILLIPRLVLGGWAKYFRALRRFLLLNALLLVFGILGNAVWMTFIYDNRYISQDTVVDFFPFIPFGQWVLDQEWGGKTGSLLNGATLWELRGWWALVAGVVWALTFLIYQRVTKGSLLPKLLRVVRLEELTEAPSPELR